MNRDFYKAQIKLHRSPILRAIGFAVLAIFGPHDISDVMPRRRR